MFFIDDGTDHVYKCKLIVGKIWAYTTTIYRLLANPKTVKFFILSLYNSVSVYNSLFAAIYLYMIWAKISLSSPFFKINR